MPSLRLQKIERLLQKELGEILQKENRTVCNGAMVTVTIVRISPDLSFARVFVSIFAPGQDVKTVFEMLNTNSKYIRTTLGNNVRHQLRIVPEIAFRIDDSLDYIENIDKLLKQ
jgi:ribosome-binding factor A